MAIRRFIVDERRQVSKNTFLFDALVVSRPVFPSSRKQLSKSLVRFNVFSHAFEERERERFRGIRRSEPLIRTNSVSSGPFDSCSSSCAVMTIGRYFRLRCLRFLATCLASSWIQEFHKSRLSLSRRFLRRATSSTSPVLRNLEFFDPMYIISE